MRSQLVRNLLTYREIPIDRRLNYFNLRLFSSSEGEPPESIESLPEWNDPVDTSKNLSNFTVPDMDQEIEDFFEKKFKEEEESESSSSELPNKDAIHRALAVFEEEFKNSDTRIDSNSPVQFTSKFGTFRSSFMRELTDVGLDDLSDFSNKKKDSSKNDSNGLIHQYVKKFETSRKEAMVESFFAPARGPKKHERVILSHRDDILQDSIVNKEPIEGELPIFSKGGFRISVYRNVTGSIKQLLQNLRNDVLSKFIAKMDQFGKVENQEFLKQLIGSLKYENRDNEESMKSYILPQMNTICLMLLERLPFLSADEIALVCLVFGKLGYVNSLIFHRLFTQLQNRDLLSNMSHEGLFGTVLSLGMLQSTEPEFLKLAKLEFETRFLTEETPMIPRNALGSFLFGSCRSKDPEQATSLSRSVLDVICREHILLNDDCVSWSDFALALYVTHQLNIWKPELIRGVHAKLMTNSNDLSCIEASVLLLGLEHQPSRRVRTEVAGIWSETFTSLQDRIESLISSNEIDLMSIPDIIKSFSFPGFIRVHCFESLGNLVVSSNNELTAPLSLWSICFKLMAGCMNVRYRDAKVLKALNKRFLETRMGAISPTTVVQLLHVGLSLRGLEEEVVDRLVELMSATPHFWKKIHRPKDAAKAAFALAGFQKLNPEILRQCWERCQDVKFAETQSMKIEDQLETVFIAQGLFSGYQYIASRYSPKVAAQQIPKSEKEKIFEVVRKRNFYETGNETKLQGEIACTLDGMGISVACPVLILDGLYAVVVFAFKARSYFVNPPHELTGRAIMHVRELEALGIKVVCIKDTDWLALAPEQRTSFLESKFTEQGISIKKLKALNAKDSLQEASSEEDPNTRLNRWLRDRVMVLKELKFTRLKELHDTRKTHFQEDTEDVIQKSIDAILEENELLPPSFSRQMETPTTKSAIIRCILRFEVRYSNCRLVFGFCFRLRGYLEQL
eukprot:g3126.t1